MQITARLDEATIIRLMNELFPLTIALDDSSDERWLEIAAPQHVELVAAVGLRVRTTGRLRWTLAGMSVPVTLNVVQLLLRPEIGGDERGGMLVLHPELEELDLKNIPSMIDQPIQNAINQRLDAEAHRLAWHFGESLGLTVPLPPEISPPHTLHIQAPHAAVVVDSDALRLSIDVDLRFVTSS
jgi:hypothetical protein